MAEESVETFYQTHNGPHPYLLGSHGAARVKQFAGLPVIMLDATHIEVDDLPARYKKDAEIEERLLHWKQTFSAAEDTRYSIVLTIPSPLDLGETVATHAVSIFVDTKTRRVTVHDPKYDQDGTTITKVPFPEHLQHIIERVYDGYDVVEECTPQQMRGEKACVGIAVLNAQHFARSALGEPLTLPDREQILAD